MALCCCAFPSLVAACSGDPSSVEPGPSEHRRCPESYPFEGEDRVWFASEVDRLAEIQARHEEEVFSHPHVIGMGISWDAVNCLAVFDVSVTAPSVGLPWSIEGVPVRVELGTELPPL